MACGHLNDVSSCSHTSTSIFTDTTSSLELTDNISPLWLASTVDEVDETDLIHAMESTDQPKTVAAAMEQILSHMKAITDHFREKGENEAANTISRHTVAIIDVFNTVTADWDPDTSTMQPQQDTLPPPREDQVSAREQVRPVTTPALPMPAPITTTASWANVAAVAPAASNALVRPPPTATMVRGAENQSATGEADIHPDKRVIWIRGWEAGRPFSEITNKIGQGPIYSIAFSEKESSVCVIFQSAAAAKALHREDQEHTQNNGTSRFGPGCDVSEGLPFAETDDMRRMMLPLNERRRLTFARQQLFARGMTEQKFKDDINVVVGEHNVELVWLFNTGNATVVFSSVTLARMVRDTFMKMAKRTSSPYHGVTISFSHDPCERPMSLMTQMPAGRSLRNVGTYGGAQPAPEGPAASASTGGRRITGANNTGDGWQTISRRR